MNDYQRHRLLTMEDANRNIRLTKAFVPFIGDRIGDRFVTPHDVSIDDSDDELLQAAVRLINHFGGLHDIQIAPNHELWEMIRLVRGEQPSPFSGLAYGPAPASSRAAWTRTSPENWTRASVAGPRYALKED